MRIEGSVIKVSDEKLKCEKKKVIICYFYAFRIFEVQNVRYVYVTVKEN